MSEEIVLCIRCGKPVEDQEARFPGNYIKGNGDGPYCENCYVEALNRYETKMGFHDDD